MDKSRVLRAATAILASSSLTMGSVGAAMTKSSEGYHRAAYRDPVGITTVCYGHTDPNLRIGMTFTDAECNLLFRADNASAQSYLSGGKRDCVGNVPLTSNQRDALRDFIFNVGGTTFCKSSIAKHLRAKRYTQAAQSFLLYKYAGKRVLPGLVIRRANEQRLFNSRINFIPYSPADLALMGAAKANS
jgi:lysozyme